MFLEIVTPEKIVFSAEVDSVAVPGINGEFQMLNSHAPVISLLANGTVKINTTTIDDKAKEILEQKDSQWTYGIKGGVIEVKNNKVIILAD